METYNLSTAIGLYNTIDSVLQSSENACSNGGSEMSMMDEAHFELPLYPSIESPWYSGSSEDLNTMDGFYGQSVNSSTNVISAPEYSAYSQSAFSAYIKADSNAAVNSCKKGQILHKSCFRFLRLIEQQRKLASQFPSPVATRNYSEDQQAKSGFLKVSAFQHKIAERTRRMKLRQLFVHLYSFLPRNSKKDKHSILTNTTKYLNHLKIRVAELEQQNEILQQSIPINKDEGSNMFDLHEESLNSETTVYRSDEVSLELSKDIPCQVNIRISVQKRVVSCPTSAFIKALECLRKEKLEVLSIRSDKEPFRFHASILVRPKVCTVCRTCNSSFALFTELFISLLQSLLLLISKLHGVVQELRECFVSNVKGGQDWDTFKWQTFGALLRRSLL